MKLYMTLESLHLNADIVNDKHNIIEKAMKIYSKMMRTRSKTHCSVADKHLGDVCEIEQSILLDYIWIDFGSNNNSNVDGRISEKMRGKKRRQMSKKR